MPLKIGVSMSDKASSSECDSLTVHCTLEFDDDSMISQDNEAFQNKIHSVLSSSD